MSKYAQHPLSAAFPAMPDEDFQALKDSIDAIGVQNPITLFEGMVIDGWHRYTAANDLGMHCPVVDLGNVDPREFVLAQNKARRHVTQAQLALATTAVYAWKPVGANQHESRVATECPPRSNAELAAISGVGVATIKQAKSVQSNAAPEVIEAVKSGAIGLPKAAAIAKLPKEEQAAAIAKPAPKKPAQATPVPVTDGHELQEAAEAINSLAEENERLRDRLAVAAMEATAEEQAEAAQIIADLRHQIKALEAELDATRTSRDGFQRQNAELMVQIRLQQKQIKKLSG
ncbi:MAG: hypothetical protein BWY63_02883 [Chloroflexi bacterium ADurb.Bin360]|nr:MAG: hypothetical protein BWY63_02883 [Chloroflexi bacterium ADurb.Bin360]